MTDNIESRELSRSKAIALGISLGLLNIVTLSCGTIGVVSVLLPDKTEDIIEALRRNEIIELEHYTYNENVQCDYGVAVVDENDNNVKGFN